MAEFLLSVHHDYDALEMPDQATLEARFESVDRFNRALQAADAWVFAGGLLPPDQAVVVDGTATDAVTTEGPAADCVTQLGGFWVINVQDLLEARAWAMQASSACESPVEVRAFQGA
ncbi:YciI family protein [Demequina sp. B12]|uniref:YciI family protein n=1 Tax=Demequina sp. B12 TaxID=2992757 RepID=UPI00237B7322|nr:YciI family protein [Demequina sp. B12]MDE0571877.1 YciI family protein [Demequina sp. B12]